MIYSQMVSHSKSIKSVSIFELDKHNILIIKSYLGAYLEGIEPPPPKLSKHKHESLKFGQLTIGKIIKIVATRCQILMLKCNKFNFGWGSAPDPAGGAYSAPPDPLAKLRGPTSKGRRGDSKGRGGGEKGKNGKGRGGGA